MVRKRVVVGSLMVLLLLVLGGWRLLSKRQPPVTAAVPKASPRAAGLSAPVAEPTVITGQVLDLTGKAVAGARVSLFLRHVASDFWRGAGAQGQEAITDTEGRYTLESFASGEHRLVAQADGHGPSDPAAVTLRPGRRESVDLRLTAVEATLSGQILDPEAGAIPAARLIASSVWESPSGRGVFSARAGADGRYSLALPTGVYNIVSAAPGYSVERAWVTVAGRTTRDFRLEPAARVTGRVLLGDAPVAGATVQLASHTGPDETTTTSNDEGRFEFLDARPGTYGLSARHSTHSGRAPQAIVLARAGLVADVEVRLQPAHRVSGRVEAEGGKAVPDVGISLWRTGSRERSRLATSDGKGAFVFLGVEAGDYVLGGSSPTHVVQSQPLTVSADVGDVVVRVKSAAAIEGHVRGRDGAPVTGVEIAIELESAHSQSWRPPRFSDRKGFYRFEGLPAGRVRLAARHPTGASKPDPFDLASGETRRLDLALEKGAEIAGRVVDERDLPWEGVLVHAHPVQSNGWGIMPSAYPARTSPDGTFAIQGLSAGGYSVSATRPEEMMQADSADPRAYRTVVIEAGVRKSGLTLVLPRTSGSISGTVVAGDGKPVSGAIVLHGPQEALWAAMPSAKARAERITTGEDGRFLLKGLEEAPHTIWATHPDHPPARLDGVRPGRDVRLTLPREATLAGVVTQGGKPVPSYQIALRTAERGGESFRDRMRRTETVEAQEGQAVNDPQGAFELRRVLPGIYDVVASGPGGAVGKLAGVEVKEGERKRGLQIALTTEGVLTGLVVEFGSDTPVAGARVFVLEGNERASTESGSDGRFALKGLVPGTRRRISIEDPRGKLLRERHLVEVPSPPAPLDLGTVRLVPRTGELPARAPRPKGFGLAMWRGLPSIAFVDAGMAAANAGVKMGDVIVAVGGKNVRGQTSGPIGFLLESLPEDNYEITIQTGNEPPRVVKLVPLGL